jgi:hypothetical protein
MFRSLVSAMMVHLVFSSGLLAAPVPAGGKAKDVAEIPVRADSMLVVQLNGVTRTKERVQKMLEQVDAAFAKGIAAKLDEQLKEVLEGRDLKGLDLNGRVFLSISSFAELGNGDLPIVVALPVADYKTFREKFLTASERKSFIAGKEGVDEIDFDLTGKSVYLVDNKAGYVIASANQEAVAKYAEKYESLTTKRLGTLAESFLTADATLYLNMERVNEVHGAQIQQGKALFNLIFQQGGMRLDQRQMEAMRVLFEGMFQVIADATGLVIALEARPEGANLRFDLGVQAETPSANVLAKEKPNPLKALDDLPKGMIAYSASRWGKALADLYQTLGGEVAAPEGDDKLTEVIKKWMEAYLAADGETVTVSGPQTSSLTTTVYADPSKVTAAKLKLMKRMTGGATYSNFVLKENPMVKEADQKLSGFTFHAASVEVDYQASVKNVPDEAAKEAAIEAMKKLVPEKQTVWFGDDGKRFVQVTAKDWATAKKLIDGFADPKARVGDDAAFAATRKQMPAEASYLALYETAETLNMISDSLNAMDTVVPVPGLEIPKLGKLKTDSTFIGLALSTQPRLARFDLFVPTAAVKVIRQIIEESEKE